MAAHQAPPSLGILQVRTLEWIAISFSNAWKWKVKVKSLSLVWLFVTPWTAAYQAPSSAVILKPQKIKSDTVSTVSPSISHEVMGPDDMILVFWMLSFKPTFSLSPFFVIKFLEGRSLLIHSFHKM